jgi:hypothetical protein
MPRTFLNKQNPQILELAQKWRTGTIDEDGFAILESWYFALENLPLGWPDELTVDKVEKRLHEQYFKPLPKDQRNDLQPPWDTI